jgi:hypothetical protein
VTPAFRNLYFLRVAMAACWIALVSGQDAGMAAGSGGHFRFGATLLLAAYPLVDAIGTFVDLRSGGSHSMGHFQVANLVVDLLAAVAILVLAPGVSVTMNAVAAWAIVVGVLMVVVGVGRRNRLRGQWALIVSGAGSIVGGFSFVGWSLSALAAMDRLVQYSIGGTVLYLVSAFSLLLAGGTVLPPSADAPRPDADNLAN